MKSLSTKKIGLNKKLLAAAAMLLIFSLALLPSVFAQDYTDISVTLDVDEGQTAELTLDGCWIDTGGGTWDWSGSDTISLKQPGDRETGGETGDRWTWYDTPGGIANGDPLGTNMNVFAYGDCRFNISIKNYSEFDIQYSGTNFEDGFGHFIPDMLSSGDADFNFRMDGEDPNNGGSDKYQITDGEHGFFIVSTTNGIDVGEVLNDTGYNNPKAFNATTCGDGTPTVNRPCYHQVTAAGSEKILINETAGTELTNAKIEMRIGVAVKYSATFPASTYTTTHTMTLVPSP